MSDNWRLLTTGETAEAAQVLSRAFYDDPLQNYFLPGEDERRNNAAPIFQALLNYGCLYGEVLTTASGVSAAAIWMRPGEWEMSEEGMAKAGFDQVPGAMGEDAFTRFLEFFAYIEEYHRRDAAEDHWYLAVIGVDPPLQGKGIGTSLIMPILRRADRAGLPCYVETAQQRNVPLYTRAGFKVIEDVVEPKSGVRIWTFLRNPPA